ncbi:MAG: caspase family protein [Propylenella sp.]
MRRLKLAFIGRPPRAMAAILIATAVVTVVGLRVGSARETAGLPPTDRIAIVIGNADYPAAPLLNPVNDAQLISNALADFGFTVFRAENLGTASFREFVDGVRPKIEKPEILFVYFAGHALQYKGDNRLLMTDIGAIEEKSVLDHSVSVRDFLEELNGFAARTLVLALDSCRDNPFTDAAEAFQTGLSYVEPSSGEVLIGYATRAGAVALDGFGDNSPYAVALANALTGTDRTLMKVFLEVRRDVREATNGLQIPWVSSSIETDLVLGSTEGRGLGRIEAPAAGGELSVEWILWQFIRDSNDLDDFAAFLKHFPDSEFAGEARERLSVETAAVTRGLARVNVFVAAESPDEPAVEQAELVEPLVLATTGDRSPPPELRTWSLTLPETQFGLGTLHTECDLLAADPDDPARVAPGVRGGLVAVRRAIRACAYAVADNPAEMRLLFQFGRVLDSAGAYDWAKAIYEKAAVGGYSAAMVNLGFLYRQGRGVPKDSAKGFELYMQAAKLGNLRGRVGVGLMYQNGEGVDESPEEAVLWYRLAGAQGWPNAIDALATLYRRGSGVPQDFQSAFRLFNAAAEVGNTNAMTNVGMAYVRGEGVAPNLAEGIRWLDTAVEAGNRFAPFQLARIVAFDDPERARSLLELAGERSFHDAHLELAKLYAGKLDNIEESYFEARLAEALEVRGAGEFAAELKGRLSDEQRKLTEVRLQEWLRLNGR